MPPDPLAPLLALPGLAGAAEDARRAVDRLLTHDSMRRHATSVTAEAGLRCARASAALEGYDLSLDDVRAGAPSSAVGRGALRLSIAIRRLSDTWERAPLQALARMHVLAAEGLAPPDEIGRPRADFTARLTSLAQAVTTTGLPAVVVAGFVHGSLLAWAPFGLADGLVARAAARAVLVSRGLDPRAVSAPDVGCARDPEAYAAAAAAFAGGDQAPFLLLWCDAVAHGAAEGIAIGEALLRG